MSILSISAIRDVDGVDVVTAIKVVKNRFIVEVGEHEDPEYKEDDRIFLCLSASDKVDFQVNEIPAGDGMSGIVEIAALGRESCLALRAAILTAAMELCPEETD